MQSLDLIVPGLLGPFEAEIPAYVMDQLKQPVFRTLNRSLSRAQLDTVEANDFYSTLQQCLLPGSELGVCEMTARYASIDIADDFYYRADPVHFKAESDHAVLLGPELLAVEEGEAKQLVEAFNLHFAEEGISLIHDSHGHWYLRRKQPLALDFHPLDYALGRDIKHFMPYGDDELWWRRIVNEAQMLFFQHPVNAQREQCGQLTVNGLWLWDQAPQLEGEAKKYQAVKTGYPLAIAMAELAGVTVEATASDEYDGRLMVLDELYPSTCYGDINAWLEALEPFSSHFAEMMTALKHNRIQQINVYPCDGRVFRIRRLQRYAFWKSNHTLDYFFTGEDKRHE